MDEYLEMPTMEARNWLADAARECGYPSDYADMIGYGAWWLENRGVKGVLRTCVYLLGIHGKRFDELKPITREGAAICLCPVEFSMPILMAVVQSKHDFADWTGGMATADPMLVGPFLTQMLEYKYNVHIRYHDQHVMFCQDGIAMLSDLLLGFAMTNTDSGVETALRLIKSDEEDVPLTFHYEKREALSVPKFRYLEFGGFRFNPS